MSIVAGLPPGHPSFFTLSLLAAYGEREWQCYRDKPGNDTHRCSEGFDSHRAGGTRYLILISSNRTLLSNWFVVSRPECGSY
jgi:hypothetical protein